MKKNLFGLLLIISYSNLLFSQPSIQWQKCLGGTDVENGTIIQQTYDGGYIFAGTSYSHDGDVTGNHSGPNFTDYWIIKLDDAGSIQWQKCLGGFSFEVINSIQQTNDSGFIVAGQSGSNDGDVTGNHGSGDFWVVKLNKNGIIQWQKSLGGTGNEIFGVIRETNDAGYICAVTSGSNDGDVTGNHGNGDYWIVKLDSIGVIQWQKSMGGSGNDNTGSIQQTNDGGYIVEGTSGSNDGDVTGNHGSSDYWIVKLDSIGVIQWQKSMGGSGNDETGSMQQTSDGGYIVAGYSESNDGDVSGNHGSSDYWIVKSDNIGIIQWQKSMGGTGSDRTGPIQQTSDGGYIVAGETNSNNGDVTGNHGSGDFWVVKLSPFVNINEIENPISNIHITPNPFSNITTLTFQLSLNNKVRIEIRDIESRLIKNFPPKNLNISFNEIAWDATNNSGDKVDNGIYFISIVADNFSETKKVVVVGN